MGSVRTRSSARSEAIAICSNATSKSTPRRRSASV
jgi:hypothetical protein